MKRKDRSGSMPGSRVCAKCDREFPASDYYRDRSRFDGLKTWCKECADASVAAAPPNVEGRRASARRWQARNREVVAEANRKRRRERRREVLEHYGGRCACCGEDQYEFLAIDHIFGGGTQHRNEVGRGDAFYKWLRANDYPDGFRVLCHNCNSAMGWHGYCPHERQLKEVIGG